MLISTISITVLAISVKMLSINVKHAKISISVQDVIRPIMYRPVDNVSYVPPVFRIVNCVLVRPNVLNVSKVTLSIEIFASNVKKLLKIAETVTTI